MADTARHYPCSSKSPWNTRKTGTRGQVLADCFYHLDNLTEAEKSLHRAAELSHKSEVIQQWQALRAEMGLPSSDLPE